MKNRIDSLDWLRGLLAVSILLYHIISWETGKLGSSSFLGKLGVYGVSMFFVLSGLSMALVYSHYIKDVRTSVFFFIRRIVRIWPLMWFAVFSSVFIAFLAGNRYPISKIVLNITTLFGFVNHSASTINTGAWSIGNEMVYYSLTPFILILYNWRKWCGNIVLLASVVLAVYFSGYAMDSSSSLGAQWGIYKNPFNNFFLYCAGIALYYNFSEVKKELWVMYILATALSLFIFYPISGDQIFMVTGVGRVVFSVLSVIIVYGFYKMPFEFNNVLGKALSHLGTITYGVYLLHPLVYGVLLVISKRFRVILHPAVMVFAVLALTIILALIVYHLYELKFIQIGKRLTQRTPQFENR